MPGLVGIIGKGPGGERRRELHRMLACMHNKNALSSGEYVDEEKGVYVGWTCHADSYADCLPIADASREMIMFFAGEHFSMDAGEAAPFTKGHGCPVDKAAALLPLYRQKGNAFFASLNGFFHGLIIDNPKGSIILFNDRFGMQRLYYYEEPEGFYFASEAKSLLTIRAKLRSFDWRGLGEWLSCGAVLEDRSLFRDIRVLQGGSRWTWGTDRSFKKEQYFKPQDWEARPPLSPGDFYSKLQATFVERLPAYLRWRGRIGMSTTGGLDTRMILANLRVDRKALHCYSFCGPVRENLDVSIGRRVAHAAGFDHTTLTIDKEFFLRFDELAKHVITTTDGNLDLSGVPEAFFNEMSRAISPIRLAGNYGSEVLRRYRSITPSDSICGVLDAELAESVKNAGETWARARTGHPLTSVVFKQIPWFSYNRLQFEQADLIMRSPFMDNALLEVVYQAPAECAESTWIALRLIHDGNPLLSRILTDRGVSYPRRPAWPLTRAYYELIFKLEYYASHGMPKGLAAIDKRLGVLSLEHNFLGRNKYYHLRQWFRDELAPYVSDILLDPKTLSRDYLDRKMVIQMVKRHLASTENATHTIDKLLTLELSNRLILEPARPL